MRLAEGIENHTLTGNKRIELCYILSEVQSENISHHISDLILNVCQYVKYLGKNADGVDHFLLSINGNFYFAKGELNSGQY